MRLVEIEGKDLPSQIQGKIGETISLKTVVYRTGVIKDFGQGIFFAGDKQGAEGYTGIHKMEVLSYYIETKSTFVIEKHHDLWKLLFPHELNWVDKIPELWLEKKMDTTNAWRYMERLMVSELLKNGNDSIAYTSPPAPAKSELAIINIKSVLIKEL